MCQQGVTASHGFMREVLAGLEAQQNCKPCKFYRYQSHLSLASLMQCILLRHVRGAGCLHDRLGKSR